MQDIFFQGWSGPGRILLVGVLSYAALVLILRATGKRTLSKLNAFDLVVTIALGSTLSSIILDTQVALVEGVTALALLAFLQFAVAWTTARLPFLRRYITAEPALLLYEGRLKPDALKRERVVESEVLQAVRDKGGRSLEEAEAVFLQSDGSMAVVLGRSA